MKRIVFYIWMVAVCVRSVAAGMTGCGLNLVTMDEGLPSNAVRNVVQDRYGFMWFGTDNGLCRYDGMDIFCYRIADNGIDQYISALYCTDNGLIVGTGKGVFFFEFRTERFTRIVPELTTTVTCITQDKGGAVWISSAGQGVYCYSLRNGTSRHYTVDTFGGHVARLLVTKDNQIWAVTLKATSSPARLNKVRDRFELVNGKGQASCRAIAMLQTADGTIWVGTWESGLIRLHDDGTSTLAGGPASVAGLKHIHTMVEYAPDCILIGCESGLMSYNPQTDEISTVYGHLPMCDDVRFVYSIHRDTEGGLWLGTFYDGVVYVSPMAKRFESEPGNVISRFCEDGVGRIWIASDDGGLRCWLPKEHRYVDYPQMEQFRHLNVHALCMDGDDLWVGTYTAGVFVLNTRTGAIRSYVTSADAHSLDDFSSYSIFRDSHDRIWVATMRGLCLYDRLHDSFKRVKSFSYIIMDIDEDCEGRLWFSTQGDGLWRYDGEGHWKHYVHTEDSTSLSDNQVNCTFIDSGGRMWVGTYGGDLCRYDSRKDRFVRVPLDIPKPTVCSIVEEGGSLWLALECGVAKYEPGGELCRFTRHDGLISEQFLPNSGVKASDGRIYFGSIKGFNVFSPYQIKVNTAAPPVFITSLELFNRPVEVGGENLDRALAFTKQVNLSWRDRMFSLSFASLSYCSPEKNRYAYMLEGFDKQWIYAGTQRKATYTNIPAGTYTFRVKATNNDGVWSTDEARLRIVVHHPFWWSLPAKILYGLLVVALIYAYVQSRLRRAERHHLRELKMVREAKEREAREARLSFFTMIAHEIRTPVSLIIGPLENVRQKAHPDIEAGLEIIDRNARRLLELVNQLLDFRKIEQKDMVMHFAPQSICALLHSVCERFEPTFAQGGKRFEVDYPDYGFTAIIDREAITKVVSNLLTNANKYTKDYVHLRCFEEPDGTHFCIEVTDNGVGVRPEDRERIFRPFYQAQDNKPGTGIGLSIVKNIVTQHGGTITVDSIVGRGATFIVRLPVSQAMTDVRGDLHSDIHSEAVENGLRMEQAGPTGRPVRPETSEPVTTYKPVMLIVEDNADMVRFLTKNFEDTYRVISAGDGIEALDRIHRLQSLAGSPDDETVLVSVIVSDWMMPRMDGVELCRRVRQDPATSHIPFILLTARTDDRSKVEGMDVGADAYIEKPFSITYLQSCVRNMLEMRRKLRERFNKDPLETVSGVTDNRVDDEFLTRMTKLIEENFSNPDLTVQFFTKHLDISRSGLFAKLKTLTDLTPNEMVQMVRLKKGAQLLREGRYTVSQVCYMVGFSSPSYFSKCFARQFGIRPTEFCKQMKTAPSKEKPGAAEE